MKTLVTWLPVVVAIALLVGFLTRSGSRPWVDPAALAASEPPAFQPVVLPHGSATLRGRVFDDHGEPVRELPIYTRSANVAHWAYTDADGRFVLDRLFDEEHEVLALAFGRPTQSFRLRPGDAVHELRLAPPRPAATRLPDLPRSDLTGWVARALEGPLAGLEVLLEPVDPPNVLQGAVPVRALVADDGAFDFRALAHARYRVRILPAWARGGSWPDLVAPEFAALQHDGTQATVTFELGDGALAGRVEHEDGSPLAGALVLVHPSGDESRPYPAGTSDAQGAFRIADLPAGRYALEVRAGEDVKSFPDVEVERREVAALPPLRLVVRNPSPNAASKP
ncbi:MAG: carboxypeptidase-like regulatory domain-containing protein [Planctomycetes bacterium]|nr:carboxypeptidase-like regulatory domain-containing protein [Planctomycetota bacterium]